MPEILDVLSDNQMTLQRIAAGLSVSGGVVLAAGTRAGGVTSALQSNPGCTLMTVVLNVTGISAGIALALVIEGQDPASGAWYDLLGGAVSPGVTAAGTYLTVVGYAATGVPVPATWRARVTPSGADPCIYSVGVSYHP